jgi:hypothetical protein
MIMIMNAYACIRGPCGHVPRRLGLGEFCRTTVIPSTRTGSQTRCHTIPIFRKGNIEPEEAPNSGPSDGSGKDGKEQARDDEATTNRSSSETALVATDTQDIVADWDGTLRDGTVVRSGWFGGDSAFTVALIVGLSVISTLFLTHGVGRFKHSKATRQLRQRVKVDAPVIPREDTAKKYPTGWPMEDEPSYTSSTMDSGYAERGGIGAARLPLRGPDGDRLRNEYIDAEWEKYEDLKTRVDGIGKPAMATDGEEGFDMYSDDDYAKGSRMTHREMKERANKASESAARAAAHAHQASVASTIASEACNEAAAAAHRALQASMKTQRALERSSGQHIMEIYEAAKKEEAIAERRARVAAEMSARGLMEEFKSGKASKKAVAAADASRPHGLVNLAKAWSYDARAFLSSAMAHGREAALQGKTMLRHAVEAGKGIVGTFKEHMPIRSSE